jgi:hypothetical protein
MKISQDIPSLVKIRQKCRALVSSMPHQIAINVQVSLRIKWYLALRVAKQEQTLHERDAKLRYAVLSDLVNMLRYAYTEWINYYINHPA